MSLKTFWIMSNNVERIRAEQDYRDMSLHIAIRSESKEMIAEKLAQLKDEMGDLLKVNPKWELMVNSERDIEGVESLKQMQ